MAIEEERATFGTFLWWHFRVKPAPLLSFIAGHNGPTDGLGVFEDPGLDGLVFSWGRHRVLVHSGLRPAQPRIKNDIVFPAPSNQILPH